MGDYLNFIRDLPINGKIGQRVVARLATYRALGITQVDPEEIARQAVWDEINAMPAVRRYHGETVPQATAKIRSAAVPVKSAAVLRDSTRPTDDADNIRDGGDAGGGVYADEVEAARHPWR
jgi:hypothetical protein